MRPAVSEDDVREALAKTGFPLEHTLTEKLRAKNFGVLSNRYYVDDTDGRARELDLIAYKIHKLDDVDVVTTVLVSCKKDEANTWSFLSRKRNAVDKNIDWRPVHWWTDVEPLNSYLNDDSWKAGYLVADKRANAFALDVKRDVFAFQLVSPPGKQQHSAPNRTAPPAKAAAPQNDKPIFDSITGLLKALDYELNALSDRVPNRKRLYLFSLAVVVDAPMVEARYDAGVPEVKEVRDLLTLARYMVRGQHMSAQVLFFSADRIDWFIEELNYFANANASFFKGAVARSFEAIKSSKAVRSYFANILNRTFIYRLNFELNELGYKERVENIGLEFDDETLVLEIDTDDQIAEVLNENTDIATSLRKWLRNVCRYEGDFEIRTEVPF